MISGRQTLGSIDAALHEQQQKIKFADGRLAALGGNLLELQQAQVEQFRALARDRVDYLASDKLMSSFDESEQQVRSLLEHRKTTALELGREIESLEQSGIALEKQRSEQADALEQASARVDEAEAETQRRLDAIDANIETHEKQHQQLLERRARLKELEASRAEFKRRRYDHPRSEFADGALIGVALNNFLEGMLKSDSMWDVLQKQQRPRLGRGTPWGGSGPGRKRGGSGGGFRTGGGF